MEFASRMHRFPPKILIVEDQEEIRLILSSILTAQGHTIVEAVDGEDALEKVRTIPFDMIMLDRGLPKISGLDVLLSLKANPLTQHIPVLLLTGESDSHAQVEGLKAGANDYIVKPFEQSVLLARVQVLLRLKAQSDELRMQRNELEDKNILLTLKNAELDRLVEFKNSVLKRLGDPDHGIVADIISCADTFSQSHKLQTDLLAASERLSLAAQRIKTTFRPHDYLDHAEAILNGRTVVVLESDRLARNFTSRAVFATGAHVHAFETAEQTLEFLSNDSAEAIFIDWENANIIPRVIEQRPNIHLVLRTNQSLFEGNGTQMLKLPLSSIMVTNVLSRTEENDPLAVRELVTTVGKLLSLDIFGLEKYLGWGTAIYEVVLTASDQRSKVIDRLHEFALQCGLRTKTSHHVEILIDELIMNAIWDAPIDEEGHPKYTSLPRQQVVRLKPEESVVVRYGCDGNFLAVSVTDLFGRLEYEVAARYLTKCFAHDENQIHLETSGAGIGLYMAYNMVSSFIINVNPGHKTEVIGLFNLHRLSPRQLSEDARSFCYFRATPPSRSK